jgi:uncharacterized protein (TIGR03067 family)
VEAGVARAGGRKAPAAFIESHGSIRIIKGDTLTEIRKGHENDPVHSTIKLDPSKSPKEIDLIDKDPDPGQQPIVLLAIYKLEGDLFTECMTRPGNPRPTEFKSDEKNVQLRVFQRVNR